MLKQEAGWQRCPGSGESLMLAWPPNDTGYPGAVVCTECSFGVLVQKRSVHEATSQAGFEGLAGTVRVHYVKMATRRGRMEPEKMRYTR